jgi:precorrin-2/cobalt-factor-2 C20-methyltransferase
LTGSVSIIGVGPGDPELLTIRAARVLAECSLVLHAGRTDDSGFAFDVVSPLLRSDQVVRGMALTMKRCPDEDSVGYDRVAQALIEAARSGRHAAFLTEGDPMLYGSGSYVARFVRALAPEVRVQIIPGVSAISAAAARLGWPLAQKSEILTICPASYHRDELGLILDRAGSSCWLKAASVLPQLVEELRQRNRLGRTRLP